MTTPVYGQSQKGREKHLNGCQTSKNLVEFLTVLSSLGPYKAEINPGNDHTWALTERPVPTVLHW